MRNVRRTNWQVVLGELKVAGIVRRCGTQRSSTQKMCTLSQGNFVAAIFWNINFGVDPPLTARVSQNSLPARELSSRRPDDVMRPRASAVAFASGASCASGRSCPRRYRKPGRRRQRLFSYTASRRTMVSFSRIKPESSVGWQRDWCSWIDSVARSILQALAYPAKAPRGTRPRRVPGAAIPAAAPPPESPAALVHSLPTPPNTTRRFGSSGRSSPSR